MSLMNMLKTTSSLLLALSKLLKNYSSTACMYRLAGLLVPQDSSRATEHMIVFGMIAENSFGLAQPDTEQVQAACRRLLAEPHMSPFGRNSHKQDPAQLALGQYVSLCYHSAKMYELAVQGPRRLGRNFGRVHSQLRFRSEIVH
jgi:hypothetical protein